MNLSLVGSQMSSDTMSEQLSVCEGAGYDEVFGSGHESERFSGSLRRKHQPSLLTMMLRVMLRGMRRK